MATTSRPTSLRRSSQSIKAVDFELAGAARRVVEGALSIVPGERLLVVSDRERCDIAEALADAARIRAATAQVVVLEDLGARPITELPERVKDAMATAQASVFLGGFETAEFPMRAEMLAEVGRLQLRHAHMVGVTRTSMTAGMAVDPQRIAEVARKLRMRLRADSTIRVRSAAGTDLVAVCDPACRWVQHDGIIRPGRFENLPAGLLMTTPADVRGVYVADASVSALWGAGRGALAATPVRLEIDGGVVRSVACPDRQIASSVERFLRSAQHHDRVGTVSFGTNVGILEAIGDANADEKMPGVHVQLGDPLAQLTGARWTAREQLGFRGTGHDVEIDGDRVMRSGKYIVS